MATLTLPDGKEIKIPIIYNEMNERYLDIRALYPLHQMLMFDPGYGNTASCASSITYSSADGTLRYRGYDIHDLVYKASFEEVSYLLLYGQLPKASQLAQFEKKM